MNIPGSASDVERRSVRMGSKYLSGQCVKLGYLEPLMQVREFEVASGPHKFIYRTGQFVVEQIGAIVGRKVGFLESQELVIASTHADKHVHQLFTGYLQSSRHVGIQFAGSDRTSFDHLSAGCDAVA